MRRHLCQGPKRVRLTGAELSGGRRGGAGAGLGGTVASLRDEWAPERGRPAPRLPPVDCAVTQEATARLGLVLVCFIKSSHCERERGGRARPGPWRRLAGAPSSPNAPDASRSSTQWFLQKNYKQNNKVITSLTQPPKVSYRARIPPMPHSDKASTPSHLR